MLVLTRKYQKSTQSIILFCKENNVKKAHIETMLTHLNLIDDIDEQLKNYDSDKASFRMIPKQKPAPKLMIAEVMPSQNDIDISIGSTIKVTVSPQVSSENIIKIIQLLKEI